MNNLITISGTRGVGKDTLIARITKEFGFIKRIIPCTTREKREGEVHGLHQYFLSEEEFESNLQAGNFVFTNPPNKAGYRSGTLKSELNSETSIVDITVQGAEFLRNYVFGNGGRTLSILLIADYVDRFARIKKRQPDLVPLQIERLIHDDPSCIDPKYYPDWLNKIENKDGEFDATVREFNKLLVDFLTMA